MLSIVNSFLLCASIVLFTLSMLSNAASIPAAKISPIILTLSSPQQTMPVKEYTISAYSARQQETDSTPHQTATMERPIAGRTAAVSRDLISWLGGWIYIEGIGVRKVNDLMHERFSSVIDLFTDTKHAKAFGRQTKTVIFLGR